ncbi:MAG: DUF167 domain-containing protein [Desulfovibrionaceae bacterium]
MRPAGDGVWRLDVWAQPGAKSDEAVGLYQGCVKVRVAAPAVDNKANKALARFLSRALGLKASQVRIESGHAARKKTFRIESDNEPSWSRIVPDGVAS